MREEKKNAKKIYKEEKQTNKIREKKKKGTAVIRIFQVLFLSLIRLDTLKFM